MIMDQHVVPVPTRQGEGRLHVSPASPAAADAATANPYATTLLLGHGAGGGIDAMDLTVLARTMPEVGVTVARFEQPWKVAGRKVAGRPPTLDEAWVDLVGWVRTTWQPDRLFAGGRSAGARVACRTATELAVEGVVCCAFPLHPPGRPESTRIEELLAPDVAVLVLQGSRDAFGSDGEVAAAIEAHGGKPTITITPVSGADHGLKVAKANPVTPAQVRHLVATSVAEFCLAGE